MTANTPTPESVVQLRLAEVLPAADNVRGDVGDVTELAASIAEVGVLEPLIVMQPAPVDGKLQAYRVVVGHRRLAGAKLAGIPTVPAIIRKFDERERVMAMVVENLQRQDLTPLEEARAYRRLVDLGLGQVELSKRIGRSQALVSKRLSLLKLPELAQAALAAGELHVADALDLVPFEPEVIAHTLAAVKQHGARYVGDVGRIAANVKQKVETDRKRTKTLQELAAAKVSIIQSSDGWAPAQVRNLAPLGDGYGCIPMTPKAHASSPCHAAWVDHEGKARYVCTKPANHLKSEIKTVAKAAKALTSGGRSSGPSADKKAREKAAATRDRNKALRAALPVRRKLAGRLITSKVRAEAREFALRQLIQLAIDKAPDARRIAAELLELKHTTRDGDPSFKTYAAGAAHVEQLAYALGLALGEVSFATLDRRNYFDEEYASHAARYFAHLKAASYKATPAELEQIKPSGWRPAWDGAGK